MGKLARCLQRGPGRSHREKMCARKDCVFVCACTRVHDYRERKMGTERVERGLGKRSVWLQSREDARL